MFKEHIPYENKTIQYMMFLLNSGVRTWMSEVLAPSPRELCADNCRWYVVSGTSSVSMYCTVGGRISI